MITDKRIDEIVKHLHGTKLQIGSVLTVSERNDHRICALVYDRLEVDTETLKWKHKNVAT